MLAAPLLRVTIKKGMIMPLFCTGKDGMALAERILEEFQESFRAREKKSQLYDRISEIESSSQTDYKLVRGLCALLERRCVFSAHSFVATDDGRGIATTATTTTTVMIDPIDVRRMLFEESSKRGFALTEYERDSIISSVAKKLHASSSYEDIKRVMWSDFDDNLVFEQFDYIDVMTLVGWYNLSLMQTLLFNATKLEFHVSGGTNWKRILRNVKRLGLMYYLEERRCGSQQKQQQEDGQNHHDDANSSNTNSSFIVCSLEGPLSLFKLTDRYGTSLAKLLPSIVLVPKEREEGGEKNGRSVSEWQIEAWVLRKTMTQGKKLYQFKISGGDDLPHLADPFFSVATTIKESTANKEMVGGRKILPSSSSSSSGYYYNDSFDSLVEEKFARKFNDIMGQKTTTMASDSNWKLVREPDPLILAGGKAFIPDFMFENKKYGKRVYLEIVGFWTPEYLERKLQKVKQIIQVNVTGSNDNNYYDNNNDARNREEATATTMARTTSAATAVDLFIAINEELAGAKISSSSSFSSSHPFSKTSFSSSVPQDRLIFYKNDSVPIRPILDYLKTLGKELIDKKMRDPNLRIAIHSSKDIISVEEDLAKKHDDLPIEVTLKILSRDYGDQYISVGGSDDNGIAQSSDSTNNRHYLISRQKAKEIALLLQGVKTFTDACTILSQNDIPEACHAELIDKLGYAVIWQSMDIGRAVIEKKKDH